MTGLEANFEESDAHRDLLRDFNDWLRIAGEQAAKGHWSNVVSIADRELERIAREGMSAHTRHLVEVSR